MAPFTYQSQISANGTTGVVAHGPFIAARRIAPPRDTVWQLQRIRLAASGATYVFYTNLNGVGAPNTTEGAMPSCGLWRNRIAPETEIVHVGCVPPRMTSYEPQIPVVFREADFLIFAVQDHGYNGSGLAHAFSVSLEIDVEESRVD